MKLIFIRHGDPDYRKDSLTELGIHEAKLLAPRIPRLHGNEYYVSPLRRAQQTAELALEGTDIKPEMLWWLEEFQHPVIRPDRPDRPGVGWDWLPQDWTVIDDMYDPKHWYDHPAFVKAGIKEKYDKAIAAFDDFLKEHGYERSGRMYKAVRPSNDTLIFFCHFGLITMLLAHMIGVPTMPMWQGFIAAPTSVTTVVTEERTPGNVQWRCISYGDTSHLYAAGEEAGFSGRFCECYSNENERH